MSLIRSSVPPTPAGVAADMIQRRIDNLFEEMKATFAITYGAYWNDPEGISAELKTEGTELFRLAGILFTAINAARPGTIPPEKGAPPPEWNVSFNPDGSVTPTRK